MIKDIECEEIYAHQGPIRSIKCIFIKYVYGVMGYKLWRLKLGEVVRRDVTLNVTQIDMMCKDLEKGKERIHVEVQPSIDGTD